MHSSASPGESLHPDDIIALADWLERQSLPYDGDGILRAARAIVHISDNLKRSLHA